MTTVATTALLLRSVQSALVGIGDVCVQLDVNVSHDILDEFALTLGAIAHQLDQVHGLIDGFDGALQLIIGDTDQVDGLATGTAGPADLAVVILTDGQVRSAGIGSVCAQTAETKTLMADALLHLDEAVVEFADLLVIAAILELLGHGFCLLANIDVIHPFLKGL